MQYILKHIMFLGLGLLLGLLILTFMFLHGTKKLLMINCIVIDISYFHLSKQSRPSSGRSYKRRLIWVNYVCKSVKRRLCEVTDVCHKQGRPFLFYTFIPAKVIHCSLVHIFCIG